MTFRPPVTSDLYYAEPEETNPRVPPPIPSRASKGGKTPPPPPPASTQPKRQAPIKPPRPKDDPKDSYV